ncbi:MAG: GH25 family lysozyme [Bacteroidota bacterium]
MYKVIAFLWISLLLSACTTPTANTPSTPEQPTTPPSPPPPPTVDTQTPPKPKAPSTPLYGIDISKFQGKEVSEIKPGDQDLTFVICKATEGRGYVDPEFTYNWQTIAKQGFIRGAYHFYRTKDNPTDQAHFFVETVKKWATQDIPPIVDFEEASIGKNAQKKAVQTDLLTFLQTVEEATGRQPMIYTDVYTGNNYLDSPDFSSYPLWVAFYEDKSKPDLPSAWREWTFWQKTGTYTIGRTTNDFDVFHGGMNEMQAFIQKTNLTKPQ